MTVANLYRARPDYDLTELVVELVESEAVPFLPVLRYKASGLHKRTAWERTWELQREEDRVEAEMAALGEQLKQRPADAESIQSQIANLKSQMPDIPVPPK